MAQTTQTTQQTHTFEEIVDLCKQQDFETAGELLQAIPFTLEQALQLQAILPDDVTELVDRSPRSAGMYEAFTPQPGENQLVSKRKDVIVNSALQQNNNAILDYYLINYPQYFDEKDVGLFLFILSDISGELFGSNTLQIPEEEVPCYRAQAAWYAKHNLITWEQVPIVFHPIM